MIDYTVHNYIINQGVSNSKVGECYFHWSNLMEYIVSSLVGICIHHHLYAGLHNAPRTVYSRVNDNDDVVLYTLSFILRFTMRPTIYNVSHIDLLFNCHVLWLSTLKDKH